MKKILTIGYAATAISPYYSEEQQVRKKSEEHLKTILKNYDVELISFKKNNFFKRRFNRSWKIF